jgi:pilus assembly protein Flp/PilA
MLQMVQYLTSLVRRDEGQDLLEYALLIALIAIVCVGAITLAGTQVSNAFYNIASHI